MTYTAELIAVGTELLLGSIANTDAQFLSQQLSALGINVFTHTVVGDNPRRLGAAVALARSRADIIITTGGLGPTCDDLTKHTLAEAFGLPLVFHRESAARIQAYFEKLGRPMTENNLRQAMLPQGCTVFDNDWGTAPGCAFEADGCRVIMLPGPPGECAAMFRHRALPYLSALSDGVIVSRSLRVFGMGEAAVEELLRDKMNTMENPTLAPYAKEGEVELRLTAKAADADGAKALLDPAEEAVRQVVGHAVYGTDVPSLEAVCLSLLKERGATLGLAESCTGGLVSKRMTDLAGASAVFQGGVVCYQDVVKRELLGVPQALLDQFGAVSPQVAREMALGARRALGCDFALAITGVAGPDLDPRGNPPGLVYLALATPSQVLSRTLRSGGGRTRIRTQAASSALDLLRRHLTHLPLE